MKIRLFLVFCTVLYAATLLWLSIGVPQTFTSPDENANFVFARTFGDTGAMTIRESGNAGLANVLHPRSVAVVGEMLVPGSFLGWPFFAGVVSMLLGNGVVVLTPLLALLTVCMWYDIARGLFGDRRVALYAAALLAFHPAFWYYSARSMMHNVPFLFALVFAAWCVYAQTPLRVLSRRAFLRLEGARSAAWAETVLWGLAGLAIGAALCIRTAEALWVFALVVVLAYRGRHCARRRLSWVALFLGIALPLAGMAVMNMQVYGSPLLNGYLVRDDAAAAISFAGAQDTVVQETAVGTFVREVAALLFPFGVHPRAMLRTVWHYGIALFPWMTVLAVAGMGMTIMRGKRKEERGKPEGVWRVLLWITLGLAVWLAVVYGSWTFHDNPDLSAITIGDSHVRYWLPLFALSTLFAARAIADVSRIATTRHPDHSTTASKVVVVTFLSMIAALSAVLVFGGTDGFLHTRAALFASAEKRTAVVANTEPNAIIVVDRADKFLFPYRRVIQPLRSEHTYAALPRAATLAPLYYYGIPFPVADMTYLNTVKLFDLGLRIDPVIQIGDEMLYRITAITP